MAETLDLGTRATGWTPVGELYEKAGRSLKIVPGQPTLLVIVAVLHTACEQAYLPHSNPHLPVRAEADDGDLIGLPFEKARPADKKPPGPSSASHLRGSASPPLGAATSPLLSGRGSASPPLGVATSSLSATLAGLAASDEDEELAGLAPPKRPADRSGSTLFLVRMACSMLV